MKDNYNKEKKLSPQKYLSIETNIFYSFQLYIFFRFLQAGEHGLSIHCAGCIRDFWKKAEMAEFDILLTSTVISSRGGGHRPLPKGFAEAVLWKLCSPGDVR